MSIVYGKGINDYIGMISHIRPEYDQWKNMIARCYSSHHQPAYSGCTVCDEWLSFTSFLAWLRTKDWKGKSMDKDIIVIGNLVYSPSTCLFVHKKVNVFFKRNSNSTKCDLPCGVYRSNDGKRFVSHGQDENLKQINLGTTDAAIVSHKRWQENKIVRLNGLRKFDNSPEVSARIDYETKRIASDVAAGRESHWY